MRSPRNIAITLVLVLLLLSGGAMVNVAVAWGCAIWSRCDSIDDAMRVVRLTEQPWWTTDPIPLGSPLGVEDAVGRGITMTWYGGDYGGYAVVSSGWPGQTMQHGISVAWSEKMPATTYEACRAIEIPPWLPSRGSERRHVPTSILYPGFAINTIFYAAVLWLLFAAPGFVRRRIRRFRGRCLHCGYDLRGQPADSNKCPECGRSSPLPWGEG